MLQRLSQFQRGCFAIAALCCVLVGSGCQDTMRQIRGEGFNDEFADWGEKQRPAGEQGELAGASAKSQQIERNLGVR